MFCAEFMRPVLPYISEPGRARTSCRTHLLRVRIVEPALEVWDDLKT